MTHEYTLVCICSNLLAKRGTSYQSAECLAFETLQEKLKSSSNPEKKFSQRGSD